jgi:hypothetical protein
MQIMEVYLTLSSLGGAATVLTILVVWHLVRLAQKVLSGKHTEEPFAVALLRSNLMNDRKDATFVWSLIIWFLSFALAVSVSESNSKAGIAFSIGALGTFLACKYYYTHKN